MSENVASVSEASKAKVSPGHPTDAQTDPRAVGSRERKTQDGPGEGSEFEGGTQTDLEPEKLLVSRKIRDRSSEEEKGQQWYGY